MCTCTTTDRATTSHVLLYASTLEILCKQDESAKQWGAELRVIGDLSLAPPALQAAAARLMQSSRESAGPQARAIVNICFSYTSSQELQAASDEILGGLAHSHLLPHDVGPSLLQRVMHTKVGLGVGVGVGVGGGLALHTQQSLRSSCQHTSVSLRHPTSVTAYLQSQLSLFKQN